MILERIILLSGADDRGGQKPIIGRSGTHRVARCPLHGGRAPILGVQVPILGGSGAHHRGVSASTEGSDDHYKGDRPPVS